MVSLGIRRSFIAARHAPLGLFMVGVLGLAPRALAQTATDKATAEALFVEAKRLMDEKKFAEACPKLNDSQKLDPGVGTSLNLALCYKQNGQTASAWTTYREAAAQARTAQQLDRIAFVSLGVGAACAIGGLVLIGTAPKAKEKASLELLPEFGKNQVGLRLSGAF